MTHNLHVCKSIAQAELPRHARQRGTRLAPADGSASLKCLPHYRSNLRWGGKLVAIEVLGANRRDLAINLGRCPDPSTIGKLACRSPHELHVWQTHVGRVVNHLAVLDHDQNGISILHFDSIAHS